MVRARDAAAEGGAHLVVDESVGAATAPANGTSAPAAPLSVSAATVVSGECSAAG